MDLVKVVLSPFLDEKCLANGLASIDGRCAKLFISRGLSFGIIAGALFLKVPQILKIVGSKLPRHRKAEGINKITLFTELLCFSILIAFSRSKGFPFSTWGENVFIAVQNLVIVFLVDWFSNAPGAGVLPFLTALAVFIPLQYVLNYLCPTEYLAYLQLATIPIFCAGRVPQILQNFRQRSTGQLALLTFLLAFAGGLARVFTTLQQASDPVLLAGYVIGAALNGIITAQILLYGEGKSHDVKKKSKKSA